MSLFTARDHHAGSRLQAGRGLARRGGTSIDFARRIQSTMPGGTPISEATQTPSLAGALVMYLVRLDKDLAILPRGWQHMCVGPFPDEVYGPDTGL